MSFFGGRKERFKQLPTLTGEQGSFLNQLLSNLGAGGLAGQGYESAIQNLLNILSGSPEAFEAFEAPIKRQFEEQTIPSILERFSGAGARSSSGLQQTLAQAGEQLSEGLGAQRAGLQQNAVQQLLSNFLGQSQLGLGTRAFENVFRPKQPGFFESLLGSLGPAAAGAGQGASMAAMLKYLPAFL